MGERSLVDYVQKGMKRRWSSTKHADSWTPGIPDLSFYLKASGMNSWLEAKNVTRLPARPGTPLHTDAEFTSAQAAFLLDRDGKLLCRVQPTRQYIGLLARDAMDLWRDEGWPLSLWLNRGIVWTGRINWEEFEAWLSTKTT